MRSPLDHPLHERRGIPSLIAPSRNRATGFLTRRFPIALTSAAARDEEMGTQSRSLRTRQAKGRSSSARAR